MHLIYNNILKYGRLLLMTFWSVLQSLLVYIVQHKLKSPAGHKWHQRFATNIIILFIYLFITFNYTDAYKSPNAIFFNT